MYSHASKEGIDPKSGEKTASRTKVMDKIKTKDRAAEKAQPVGTAKKGETGRQGEGRFNRQFAMEKDKKMSGMTDSEFNKNRARGGFKNSSRGASP